MMEDLALLIDNIDYIPGIENCSKSKSHLRQYVTAANFFLLIVLVGLSHGHTAILLQQISPTTMKATELIRIENAEIFGIADIVVDSLEMQSWLASVLVIFCLPGCWLLALCSKSIGRKPMLLASVALYTLAWCVIVFANNVYQLIIGRSIISLTLGLLVSLASIYQAECTEPKLRSFFNASQGAALSVGLLLAHGIGTWFHWRTTALFCGCVSFITFCFNLTIRESPIWLLNKGRYLECIHSWTFLRGTRDFEELKAMLVKREVVVTSDNYSYKKPKMNSLIHKFNTPGFLKPLGIMMALFSVTQFSGVSAVTFYCIQIISQIAGSSNAYVPTLILDTVRLISSIGLTILSKKYTLRTMLLFSAFGCSLFLIGLSVSTFYQIGNPWFPLILLFCYETAVIMGVSPIPWSYLSELFSSTHKDIGVGISVTYYYLLFFVVLKINLQMLELLHAYGTFLVFGTVTFAGSLVLCVIIPDTKNKSLKEIELMFTKDNKK